MDLTGFLKEMVDERASDVFFIAGLPVTYRAAGRQVRLGDEPLMPADTEAAVRSSRPRGGGPTGSRSRATTTWTSRLPCLAWGASARTCSVSAARSPR